MKMVAVKEILRGRGHFVDVVSEDGDVLPVDLAEGSTSGERLSYG